MILLFYIFEVMAHRFIIYFLLCFLTVSFVNAQTFDSEIEAAQSGDASAQWWIGYFYENGKGGVEINHSQAFEWYKKSADQGYAKGLESVAYFYEHGIGTMQDSRKAFVSYKKAAENGRVSAQRALGLCYELGKGVAKDLNLAVEWYTKAVQNGSKMAQKDMDRVMAKLGPDSKPKPQSQPKPSTPLLLVSNYKLSGDEPTLKKKLPFDLTLYLENKENGVAEDVVVDIMLPDGTTLLDGNKSVNFKKIQGNETKTLVYTIAIRNDYAATTLPISVNVREKTGKYAENWQTELTLGQSFSQNTLSLLSDVDKDIPETEIRQKNTYALIVAEEKYKYVDPVPYAINDASVFMEYCKKTFGIPEEHIVFAENITKGELLRSLKKLKTLVNLDNQKDDTKIVFYYAGHGIPDKNHSAYLLLNDGESNDLENGCISLQQLYEELGSINAQSVNVFLDACFSGTKRGGGMLASARAVAIEVNAEDPQQNMIVLSAAQNDETAFPYNDQKHGLFTYFLLKKIKESSGNVTLGELSKYLEKEVVRTSIQMNNKQQTPTYNTKIKGWEEMKLR